MSSVGGLFVHGARHDEGFIPILRGASACGSTCMTMCNIFNRSVDNRGTEYCSTHSHGTTEEEDRFLAWARAAYGLYLLYRVTSLGGWAVMGVKV